MKNTDCIANAISCEITVDIGITNLGKYTFPMIEEFAVNVVDVAVKQPEKYVQAIEPHK